jgi:hypothetical protein
MAWFASKMAWLQIHLVQLQIFWTSIALTFATWQHFKQGYCCLLQVHQLSYIVLDCAKQIVPCAMEKRKRCKQRQAVG